MYNKKKHVQKQAIWRSNTKKSKSTLIRAADVLFYNHAYVKAFAYLRFVLFMLLLV